MDTPEVAEVPSWLFLQGASVVNHFEGDGCHMSVTITEKAAKEVKRVIEDQKFALDNTVLRIGILAGGCSGYQYKLGFDTKDAIDESKDQVTEQFGIAVAVDKRSALHLDGTQLDFFDGLEKRGFTFNNPNVTKSCGCGNSFSS